MKEIPEIDFPFWDEDDVELAIGLDNGAILRLPGKFAAMKNAFTTFYGARNAVVWGTEDKDQPLKVVNYGCGVITCGDDGVVAIPFSKIAFMQIREKQL